MVPISSLSWAIAFDLAAGVVVGLVAVAGLVAGLLGQLVLQMSEILLASMEEAVLLVGPRDT